MLVLGASAAARPSVLLGVNAIQPHGYGLPAGRAEAFDLRTRSAGLAGRVRLYIDAGNTATSVSVGIYTDDGGRPGALLGSGTVSAPRARAWVTVPISGARLARGRDYWLAVLGHGGTLRYRGGRRGPCISRASAQADLGSLPARLAALRPRGRCPVSAYALVGGSLAPVVPTPLDLSTAGGSATASGTGGSDGAGGAAGAGGSGGSGTGTGEEGGGHGSPKPPPPENTAAPAIKGSAVVGKKLTATAGEWTGEPSGYAYAWQDCNELGLTCWAAAGKGHETATYTLEQSDTGYTVQVVVTATNEGGSTASTSQAVGPVTPAAPANTSPPLVKGSAIEGDTLKASEGTWTEAPERYAYQWQRCEAGGGSCANVSGAESASYELGSADVGHAVRVVVTAENKVGKGEADSDATSVVTSKESAHTGCFENPEAEGGTQRIEACGYPGQNNVGAEYATGKKCSELAQASATTISKAGEKVEGKDFTGPITILAHGVTLNDDCVVLAGGGGEGPAINLEAAADETTISNTTIAGQNNTDESFEKAIEDSGNARGEGAPADVVLDKDRIEDCGECLSGSFDASDSFIFANEKPGDNGLHRETVYLNEETVVLKHDTMFVPEDQTAIVFANTNNGQGGVPCGTHVTVEESFVAGSGQMFQVCGHTNQNGSGTLVLRDNRIARCLTKPIVENQYGLHNCSGPNFEGSDSHGYMPYGGGVSESEGVIAGTVVGSLTWEGNYWDDDLEAVAK